ncbi:MAG TPA: diguanylate cyclase [Kofleriaceae bacterium]|nr:diguanylate cyclase [Kofleriaceae bacterium]
MIANAAPPFIERAIAALVGLDDGLDPAEPLRFALHRATAGLGAARPVAPLLEFLESRVPGSPRSESRYRWELSHRIGVKHPSYAPSEAAWAAWRAGEAQPLARDPFEVEARLLLPILVTENLESLLDAASCEPAVAPRARALVDEAAPLARRDIARYIAGTDPWLDTFALWCLTRTPRALDLLHPLAVALAVTYTAEPTVPVRGVRYPYYDRPLVSASAQLASALLALGMELGMAADLARYTAEQRRASGGWGDDPGPGDPLTTVIAADLLARSDPSLDLAPTLAYFEATQHPDGLWRALGPEAPWLTARIIELALAAGQPFAARFRWPHCTRSLLDHKTGVPFFAHFIDLANLLASLPGLASAPIELGFIDLIGFRAFNNRHGQDAGDEVLRRFAAQLRTVPLARAVRDGGDEFLVIGAPGRASLAADLGTFMAAWKAAFHDRFGADVPAVVPRIVVGHSPGAELRALRQRLGREITQLKDLPSIPPLGVLAASDG